MIVIICDEMWMFFFLKWSYREEFWQHTTLNELNVPSFHVLTDKVVYHVIVEKHSWELNSCGIINSSTFLKVLIEDSFGGVAQNNIT